MHPWQEKQTGASGAAADRGEPVLCSSLTATAVKSPHAASTSQSLSHSLQHPNFVTFAVQSEPFPKLTVVVPISLKISLK